jgi:hypothetical protein
VAGIVIVTATSTIGWLIGLGLEAGTHSKEVPEEAKAAQK